MVKIAARGNGLTSFSERLSNSHFAVVFAYPVHFGRVHAGALSEFRPCVDGVADLPQDLARRADTEAIGYCKQIVARNPIKLAIDCHEMLACPFAVRIVGMGYVVGRGQLRFYAVPTRAEARPNWIVGQNRAEPGTIAALDVVRSSCHYAYISHRPAARLD